MDFRIADTFTSSLARLTGDEQKAVKTTAFDLQMNPASPGMQFHKLDRAKDKNFWSVRVSRDIRVIVHKTDGSLLLCYVDHHDKAYDWAEKRKLETHPKTGAAQLVEIRETVEEIKIPKYVDEELLSPPQKPLFASFSEDELLGYGVPSEWLDDVRAATEDNYLIIADHLPSEAAEALLELATGGSPRIAKPAKEDTNPFEHPDALRRFRVMTNVEELQNALEYPWEKWTVFLHPEQKDILEKTFTGAARVSGSAGTGKTIVALHRAVQLARNNPNSRVLLTTFSDTLSFSLQTKLRRLLGSEPRLGDRIDVLSLETLGLRLHKALLGREARIATREDYVSAIREVAKETPDHRFTVQFLVSEWEQIIDAWQIGSWEEYKEVPRLGRKTRLSESQRTILWAIFDKVIRKLSEKGLATYSSIFTALAQALKSAKNKPYDFSVIDECQDVSVAQLKFFAALGQGSDESLFFAGDLGQRIFQQPFSWKGLGVDIRGRSKTLRVNYRTSHQIRAQADRLLESQISDIDGNTEKRNDTISVFNGPNPEIRIFKTEQEESKAVGEWLSEQIKNGVMPHECGIFVRSEKQIERAMKASESAKISFKVLDDHVETVSGFIAIGTMHLAKGLEFRSVIVMACDDEVIPLQERIETVGEDSDLKDVYDTERQLLYVACTRARDILLVTATKPESEFLNDFLIDAGS